MECNFAKQTIRELKRRKTFPISTPSKKCDLAAAMTLVTMGPAADDDSNIGEGHWEDKVGKMVQ